MGCDGGTIPKRDELVRTKKKGEQKDSDSERIYRWRHCSVSQSQLRTPIVACELGRLYNKEEIITRLLNKTQDSSNIAHIRGLKDVKELKVSNNPAYEGETTVSPWICPVSGLEMNGKHGFCFAWTCGCVVATRAVKEIVSDSCVKCGIATLQSDIIKLNPDSEQLESVKQAMVDRRQKAKEAKKQSKALKRGNEEKTSDPSKIKKQKVSAKGADVPKATASVSGLASSILRGTEFSNVRSKEFSVANNPNHSEVYKSIFDTHKSANKKLKSNWVTCNPQYY